MQQHVVTANYERLMFLYVFDMIEYKIEYVTINTALTTICSNMSKYNAKTLSDLFKLPETGVYALVHPTSNKVHIVSTLDIPGSLSRLCKLMREDKKYFPLRGDYDTLCFVLLEDKVCRNNYRIKQTYWEDRYKKMGHSLYVVTPGVRYKAVVETLSNGEKLSCSVQLVSTNGKRITVGLFDTLKQAETFHSLYYKDGVYDIVYDKGMNELSYSKNKKLSKGKK